jgi:hypothetical protein
MRFGNESSEHIPVAASARMMPVVGGQVAARLDRLDLGQRPDGARQSCTEAETSRAGDAIAGSDE